MPPPRLLAVSDRHRLPPGGMPDWARRLETLGVDALQVREKDLPDRELFDLVRRVVGAAPAVAVYVNGRPDVALAAGAAGVHLPAAGLPAEAVVSRWGRRLAVGVSTHTLEEVVAAREAGADHVVFGPVFATPGKAPPGPAGGLEGLQRATTAGIAVLALGGVTIDRLAEVAAAGARGAAGIRCFHDLEGAPDWGVAARRAFPSP